MLPQRASTDTRALPSLPFLVVTKITPLAPRAPYKAAAAASFSTVIVSISCELIEEISPSKGIPSTTYNGLLLDAIEPIPRIRTVAEVPGWPLLLVVCTPATLPDNALVMLETWRFSSLSAFTTLAEPVNADFFAVP